MWFVLIMGCMDVWSSLSLPLDLLCLEMLSVTLALSSEMLSLTSLTYDSSSEPCDGKRRVITTVKHKNASTDVHTTQVG